MRYGTFAFFIAIWAIAAVITGAVTLNTDPASAGGSSAAFESLADNVFDAEELQIDEPKNSSRDPISAAFSFAKSAVGQVTFIFQSAMLQSEIWEGWASWIRYGILALQLPFLILLLMEGAKILSGFIPFT